MLDREHRRGPDLPPLRLCPAFRQDDNSFIVPLKDIDVRTWLPGDVCLRRPLSMPPNLRPGLVELSAGLIDPQTPGSESQLRQQDAVL